MVGRRLHRICGNVSAPITNRVLKNDTSVLSFSPPSRRRFAADHNLLFQGVPYRPNSRDLLAPAAGIPRLPRHLIPMPAILYTVRATCPSLQVRGRFLSWLSPNHVADVMRGGATSVRI